MKCPLLPRPSVGLPLLLGLLLAGCAGGSGEGDSRGSGGSAATGGSASSGGTAGPGTTGTGGDRRTGGAGGGRATGGALGSGGAMASGGDTGNGGGTSSAGGAGATTTTASGGRGGAGGMTGTGGTTTAGRTGSGGTTGTGGTATGGRTGSGGATGAGGGPHAGKWQIMLLGDSITETTCYPKLLAEQLTKNGHTNFDFVGSSLNNQGCGTAPNVQTEGHSCYLVSNLLKAVTPVVGCGGTKGSESELETWAAEKPEVVLMLFGTNDAWSSIATQTILEAYSLVVDAFRAQNPSVLFFVGQITPLNPSGCSTCEANVEALNAKLPAWAADESTAGSPVHVVNVWAALPAATYTPNSTYTSDGCHPNPAGSALIADAWYDALVAAGIP